MVDTRPVDRPTFWLSALLLVLLWADFTVCTGWCGCFDRFFTARSLSADWITFLAECSLDAHCLSNHGWLRSMRAIIGNCRSSNAAFWYFGFTIAIGIWIFCFTSSTQRSTLRGCSVAAAAGVSDSDVVCAFASRTQLPIANDSFAFDRMASTICINWNDENVRRRKSEWARPREREREAEKPIWVFIVYEIREKKEKKKENIWNARVLMRFRFKTFRRCSNQIKSIQCLRGNWIWECGVRVH